MGMGREGGRDLASRYRIQVQECCSVVSCLECLRFGFELCREEDRKR